MKNIKEKWLFDKISKNKYVVLCKEKT
jgi:hypothetical protein